MNSWVYLFSQFTPEALLFEALFIFILFATYAAFWVLKKRKYGVVETHLPAGPVKEYLNQLIGNAEQLRAQLFGLLGTTEFPKVSAPTPTLVSEPVFTAVSSDDPELARKLAEFEAKIQQQAKALEALAAEKARIEAELAQARAASQGKPADSGGSAALAELQKKIKELEEKLAEYSVIEDDLANLKRLQQENAQLKSALSEKGPPAAPPSEQSPKPAVTEPTPTPSPAAPSPAAAQAAEPAPEPMPEPTPAPAEPQGVEKTEPAAQEPTSPELPQADPAAEAQASEEPAPENAPPLTDKDADLVAEFEKMLKS